MKKLLIGLGLICGLGFFANPVNQIVYADEIVEGGDESQGEDTNDNSGTDSDDINADIDGDSDIPVEDTDRDNNGIIQKIDEFLEMDITKTIIGYVLDFGFISSIILLGIKIKGEKENREKLEKSLGDVITKKVEEEFKKIAQSQNITLTDFTNKIINDVDLLKVAVALSQDKTNESKLELLKLITSSNLSNDDKKKVEIVEENVKEEKKKVDAIKEKLTKDYKEIF